MMKAKVAIIGGAGYTAGELLRLLIRHPQVELIHIQSESQAGRRIEELHRDLHGDIDMEFDATINPDVADVYFLCKGHSSLRVEARSHISNLSRVYAASIPEVGSCDVFLLVPPHQAHVPRP